MIDLCRVQGQLLRFRLGFRVQGLDTVLQGQLLIFSA